MKHKLSTLCLVIIGLLFHSSILAENHPRTSILLDKSWGYKPLTSNKKDASLTPVTLPHTWNANYLEGTTTYNREMMVYKLPDCRTTSRWLHSFLLRNHRFCTEW